MKHLPWLVCVLLVVNTVSAEETSVPSTPTLAPLVIEVRAQRVSRSALSEALEKELGQDAARGEAERPKGALELSDASSDTIRLTYRDATGRVTTRDLVLAPNDPEALEKITIAAANLVRDQSGAISQLEAAQRAEAEAALAAALAAAPAAAPAPPPAAPPKPVYDPCHPPLTTPFGFDLAWMLGTSSTAVGRQAARKVSLGFLGTYSAGVHGFQLSILANVDRRGMCGAEIATVLNLNLGDAHGLQLALINVSGGAMHGAQLGIANFAGRGANGLQLGIANISLDAADVQLAVANVATGKAEVQLGVANYAGQGKSQLGVANVSWGDSVGQLGVLNIAAGNARTQLGVVNYARSARSPIGLLNIVPKGHTGVDAWANENGAFYGALTHGGDRIYNMYGVGARAQKDGFRLALAIGLVGRFFENKHFALEEQVLYELYPLLNPWRSRSQVARLRLAGEIKITDRFSIVPAVGYALMISEYLSEPIQAPFGVTEFRHRYIDEDGKRHVGVYGFPSFALGLRVQLSDPKRPR
jgi:hypothetical protein